MNIYTYLAKVGVPQKHIKASFASCESRLASCKLAPVDEKRYKEIYKSLKALISDAEYGAYIYGNAGSGKSEVSVAILREFLEVHKKSVAWSSLSQIIDYFFDEFKGIRPRYLNVDVLLIEEMNKEIDWGNGHNQKILERIIKTRYENKKITYFTSNYELSIIAPTYGKIIYDVMKGTTISIEFPKHDFREAEVRKYGKKLKEKLNESNKN